MGRPEAGYLKCKVNQSVRTLLERDEVLFRRGVAEWTVAHRLGVYLEEISEEFPGWVVDCEFNRQPLGEQEPEFAGDQTKKVKGDTKRPDIIIHKRADPATNFEGDNLLAIELKVNEEREGDLKDIENLLAEKGYDFGVFIDFYEHSPSLTDWKPSHLEWRPERLNR